MRPPEKESKRDAQEPGEIDGEEAARQYLQRRQALEARQEEGTVGGRGRWRWCDRSPPPRTIRPLGSCRSGSCSYETLDLLKCSGIQAESQGFCS